MSWEPSYWLSQNYENVLNKVQYCLMRDKWWQTPEEQDTVDYMMMQYAVYIVRSICSTQCVLYMVLHLNASLTDREGWWNCLFLGDGRVEDERERDDRKQDTMMKNWNLWEFHVQVNQPFSICQVQLLIVHTITSLHGLLNILGEHIGLISHILWHSLYHCHLDLPSLIEIHISTIITEHEDKLFLTITLFDDDVFIPTKA